MDFDQMATESFLFLAQEGGPPPAPGEAVEAVDGSPAGGTGPGAPPAGSPGLGGNLFYIVILMLGGMIVFSIMATRRDRKKRETMLGAVRKHDRVQTIGGVIGSVVDVKDNAIVLKVDESTNTRITFARSAVQQILSGDSDTPGAAGLRNELEETAR